MRTFAYLAMLGLALLLNWRDRRMLALTMVVGVSLFILAPTEWPDFYVFCGFTELTVALVAFRLKAAASGPIIVFSLLMAFTHYLGYKIDGAQPFSQYRAALAVLETLEVLCCVLVSAPVSRLLRNRE